MAQPPVFTSFVAIVPLLVVHIASVWAQMMPVRNCWIDAPQLSESSIQVQMRHQNSTRPDGSRSWNLITNITWERPAGLAPEDMYTLKLTSIDPLTHEESMPADPCMVGIDEIIVGNEGYVFPNLTFGQFYEFEIHLYRPVRQQKSLENAMVAFETPDCFTVTGDMDFCMDKVEIQYSGAPFDPQVNNLCRNSSSNLLRVSLSWLPPLLVNGDVMLYSIDYGVVMTPAPNVENQPPDLTTRTLTVAPLPMQNGTNSTASRLSTDLQGLDEGKLYFVKITPVVFLPRDGGMYPGHDVELTFLTANWTDPMGETTEINLAIPLCKELDETTQVPSQNKTTSNNYTTGSMTTRVPSSSITVDTTMLTATTPPRLPPSMMEPAHIALIVIFTFLIIIVIIIFIIITIRMARTGQVAKLPHLSELPAMCKKQKPADEKKKDLNMAEKGAKTASEKSKTQQTKSTSKAKEAKETGK